MLPSVSQSALAELLTTEVDALLERWAARAERFTLRDAAPALLNELAHTLALGKSRSDLRKLVERTAPDSDALRELALLRGVVLELAAEKNLELGSVEAALLHRVIDDLMLAFAERASRRQALELELRERFVSVLGHDLRNPISAIKLGSSMLLRNTQPADARKRTAERIVSSANRMLRMLEDLLDFMRLRPGSLPPLELESVSLKELCRGVVSDTLTAHPQRAIVFAADADVSGRFDRRRLAQALSNVIASALEHSPAESEVLVSLQATRGCISVRHYGPLIPAPELATIFDPFRRGDLAQTSERPARGLGLGLYLADQIVRAHGGQILAESSRETGTTFSLLLPSLAKD